MRSRIKNRNLQLGANSVIYKLTEDKKIYERIVDLAIEISEEINKQYKNSPVEEKVKYSISSGDIINVILIKFSFTGDGFGTIYF